MPANIGTVDVNVAVRRTTNYNAASLKEMFRYRLAFGADFNSCQVRFLFCPGHKTRQNFMLSGRVFVFDPIEFFRGALQYLRRL